MSTIAIFKKHKQFGGPHFVLAFSRLADLYAKTEARNKTDDLFYSLLEDFADVLRNAKNNEYTAETMRNISKIAYIVAENSLFLGSLVEAKKLFEMGLGILSQLTRPDPSLVRLFEEKIVLVSGKLHSNQSLEPPGS